MSFDLTLSFDNGPDPAVTPGVLDTLARHGVQTTFFLIGAKLADPAARACAQRAQAAGHWIGNHTWSHTVPLGQQSSAAAEAEIARTQAALAGLGCRTQPGKLFRPMGGGGQIGPHLLNAAAAGLLRAGGFTVVLWNAIPRDWADPAGWVDTALQQLALQPWTLMVLHDLPTGAMDHLDRFLHAVAARGGRLRQDFPPGCTPLRNGQGELGPITAGPLPNLSPTAPSQA